MHILRPAVRLGAIALACATSAAAAQPAAPPTSPPAPAQSSPQPSAPGPLKHVAAGSPVTIEITDLLSSNGSKPGAPFALRLAEPLIVDGTVVLPAGLTGAGEVVDAQHGGFGGAAGKLVLAARYVTFGDRRITLRALKFAASGESHVGMSMAATLVSPVGFLVQGGETIVQPGTRATAKIGEDLDLPALASPPQTPPQTAPAPSPAPSPSPPQNQETPR